MLRKNGRIFSYLFVGVIFSSWINEVLVDCSDSPKRIYREVRENNVEKKYDKNSQNEVISTRNLPEISEKLHATTSEFRRSYRNLKSKPYKKVVPRNFRVQESVPLFLPSFTNGISKEISLQDSEHKIEVKSRPNRNLNPKPSKKKSSKRKGIPWSHPSISNGVSKGVTLNNKDLKHKFSNKIPSKHLDESIPSFLPSSPKDISKQISQRISNVKLPSSAFKVTSKTPKNPTCLNKVVLRNVSLKHGRKLATFELRGRVASIVKCVEKCCKRRWCNVAYKVGGYCYSVHCPTDKACEPVKTEDSRVLSDYVLLDRPQNMNYKRNSIPGTVLGQGEKKITIQLNITNEKFRAPLADMESLDFLNVAERVENAISILLKTAVGFKSCEVASFRPTPLITNVTLKLSKSSPANETGSLLLKAVRAGKMDSTLEDASEHFKLSHVGFDMKSSKGESLVCHSEINYQNSWGSRIYGALDRQPCPRNAQGECSRRCLGSENDTVKWDVPNFSGCTSIEFRDLHEKAKQFKSQAQAKLPLDQIEAKAGIKHVQVLKKLQKLTYHHTFREHIVKQEEKNKTNTTKPRLHDFHQLKVHKLKTSKKPNLIIKDESEVKSNLSPQGLLSLTNQLLNIKEKPQEGLSINKIKSEKSHSLSIADKIGLLQPNASSLPSSEPAGPGGYHVLNQHDPGLPQHEARPVQHETHPFQHETHPIEHETHPIQHVPGQVQHETRPVQHETHPAQHVPPLIHHVSNPLQRDPHPIVEKGQNRNDISVSVSVSGEFGEPVTNETDLSGVFLKSGPDNIRSHIAKPDLHRGRIPSTNPPVQGPSYGDKNIAQPKGGYIPRSDSPGMNSLKSKSESPKTSSNTLLNWLNGALQKYDNIPSPSKQKTYQTDVSSSLSNSLHSRLQKYNGGSLLRNTRKKMDHSGTLLNGQRNPVPESSYLGVQPQPQSNPVHILRKRSLAYKPFRKALTDGIRTTLKRQASALNQGQNYYTTSGYNSDTRQDNPSSGYATQAYPRNLDQTQNRVGYASTNSGQTSDGGGSQKTSNNAITADPLNDKNAYFTGVDDDKQDLQPEDIKSSENNDMADHTSQSSESSDLLRAPSPPSVLPVQPPASSSPESSSNLEGAPPPPSFLSSYEDNPPPRPLSPLPSSPLKHPQPHPPPISPPTFDVPNPPHRPLSPLPLPAVYSSFKDPPPSSPTSSYSPSPPQSAPPSSPPPYHPPTSPPPPSSDSPPPPSSYDAALHPPAPPSTSPSITRPPSYYPAFPPAAPPPSYSPAPPTTRPSYNSAPPSQPYSQPPSTQEVNSQFNSSSYPTQPNSNPTYDSYSASSPPTYQGASRGYNSSNPNSTYDSNPSPSEPSYYTSAPTYQDSNPQYNSSYYPTQPNPNSTYDSPTSQPTYQGANSQYNSSSFLTQDTNSQNNSSTYVTEGSSAHYNSPAYPAPLNPNPTDDSSLNTPNNDPSLSPSKPTNFPSTNGINNNEYAYNTSGFQGQRIASDFNMQNIGDTLNEGSTNNSWSKLVPDYNMTTHPLNTNSSDPSSGYNNIYNPDYNVTFQNINENLVTEPPLPANTDKPSKTSDVSLQNSLYKDLGDSQTVVGFTNPNSMQANQNRSSNNMLELGKIINGIYSPRLTIEDMKKRIEEFSSGYNDKQTTGEKKTLAEQNKGSEEILTKGKHLAPMFGGDLLLAADTVKHLAKFNDYIRPPIVLDDVKEFLKSCSNILDTMNSREWKNAQRHVATLNKVGVNIMSDGNAVDWEQASRRTVAGTKNPSTLYELVEAIEAFGLSASYQVKEAIKEPIITENIVMELRTIQSDIQEPSPDITFPNISDPRIRKWAKQTNVISLSPAALDEVAQGANVEAHVSGVLFKTVGNLSIPVEEGQGNESVESGNLMSMSVFPKITGGLDPPIRIALAHLNPEMSHFKQDCVFLNASASGAEMWSNKGCKVADVNETHTTCECNHMSSFSLLVDKSQPNDFIPKTTPISSGEGGGGGGSGGGGGIIYIALLFLLILAVIIIIMFAVWRKRKGKGKDEKDSKTAKSGKDGEENEAGAPESTTEDGRGQSSRSSSSGDKKRRKKGEGRKEGRKKKKKKPHTVDKDAIAEENEQESESKPEDTRASRKRQQQKEREEQLLMKEKAMIFSDYRQPYNFLAHEEAAPDPLESSTPVPTASKADSYPRRHKRPTSFQEPIPGQPGFNLRKHNSESNFPMHALHPRWGVDSPRDRRASPQRQGSVLAESIREEPLEEQRLAEDSRGSGIPRETSTPSSVVSAKSKKKFWKRKSKENLESVQEGEPVTPEQESPKKKKKIFGKKNRSASRTSLNASQESLGASGSGQQTQNEPEILESKPPISPAKKKKFWQRKKSGSQASLDATSPRPAESGGISDEGLSGDDELAETPEKRGSILRRFSKSGSRTSLSKSGSRTSLSKSGSRSSLSKSEDSLQGEQASVEGSPKKRRSSILGKLSRSGSKSSLNKSQSNPEGLDSAGDDAGKSPKRKASSLRRFSKSQSSLSKSEDSLEGDPGVAEDSSKASRSGVEAGGKASRKPSVLQKLSKSSKTGSRRSSKSQDIPSTSGTVEDDTQTVLHPGGAEEKLSQSGSTLSLSKGNVEGEGSTLRKKKGLFGKKKSSSRTSLNKEEGGV